MDELAANLVMPMHDTRVLAKGIARLSSNPALCEELSDKARRRISESPKKEPSRNTDTTSAR